MQKSAVAFVLALLVSLFWTTLPASAQHGGEAAAEAIAEGDAENGEAAAVATAPAGDDAAEHADDEAAAVALEGAGHGHGQSGAHHGTLHLDGADLGLFWVIPFVGILMSIALGPLVAPHFWHAHFGKVALGWALAFLVPFALIFGFDLAAYETLHTALLEYIPFLILLGSLFTVAGGVRVTGSLQGSPVVNTAILAIGTVIASWMGTTGAAMLLIRPLL
ncbi:MAG: sodium:proton antiporter, partial [Rhodospirillaceae bacterium]|nr:sodium:proton antiporter [Rhodospirillaceae bacterium]